MNAKIDLVIPNYSQNTLNEIVKSTENSHIVKNTISLNFDDSEVPGVKNLRIKYLHSTETYTDLLEKIEADYLLLVTQDTSINFGKFSLERFFNVAENCGAGLVYSDYYEIKEDQISKHPTIEYQKGSLRDDFNFGPVVLIKTEAFSEAVKNASGNYNAAGFYDVRLGISRDYPIIRIPEYLYTAVETDTRKSGEKQFDYVDPKNQANQLEMEYAVTEHLKKIGAYLAPDFNSISIDERDFEFEASVVIPVRNRVKTIADAVESVLKQKSSFKFNLIVVDNHSNDGTSEILANLAQKDERIIHFIPERKDLQIGGCWNEAIMNKNCGRFAIQLDSDDIYYDESTVEKVVEKFHEEKCAMVIGSYKLTDFQLNDIPPGLVDHKEWTPDNGRNNALRINGLGAPRAFYTPLLREIKIPNVSYGEDYAVGLAISRKYQIGRIYDPVYICRRWEGNSDAELDVEKVNANNFYKDKIRTLEVFSRQKQNIDEK